MKITFLRFIVNRLRDDCRVLLFIILGVFCCPGTIKAQLGPLYYSKDENLGQKTAKFLFIRVETDKKEALVGEAILAKYRLYVAVDIEGKLSKSPSFTGFASYDMESGNANAYDVEKINGVPFRVYLIKQVQLFGLQPGVQRLQPVELEATIRYREINVITNQDAEGRQPADTLFNYTLKSPAVDILIKPLPNEKPALFSGAVGKFEVSAFSSLSAVAQGQADTIYLVLKGKGNWHEISLPNIEWPSGTEVFEPYETENINPLSVPLEGLRTIAYPVVFNKKGTLHIPPVDFTYFDPETGQYETLHSDSIRVTVTGARNPQTDNPKKTGKKITSIFTGYAIYIFPVMAILLAGYLFYRRRDTGSK